MILNLLLSNIGSLHVERPFETKRTPQRVALYSAAWRIPCDGQRKTAVSIPADRVHPLAATWLPTAWGATSEGEVVHKTPAQDAAVLWISLILKSAICR